MIVFTLLVFFVIAWADMPRLIAQKLWKDLSVYLLFFLAALTASLLQCLGVDLPKPVESISHIFKDVLGLYFQ